MENIISPKKLLNSKWTAAKPERKEKHFIVTEVDFNEEGSVIFCLIEAVMTKRATAIQWQDLKDINQWRCGWK
jgi:tryptophan-rich hypothetical protein